MGQRLGDKYARLVRIAEEPKQPRAIGSAEHARLLAVDADLLARLVDIPEIDGLTKAFPSGLKFAPKKQGTAMRPMSKRPPRTISPGSRQGHQFGPPVLRFQPRV